MAKFLLLVTCYTQPFLSVSEISLNGIRTFFQQVSDSSVWLFISNDPAILYTLWMRTFVYGGPRKTPALRGKVDFLVFL